MVATSQARDRGDCGCGLIVANFRLRNARPGFDPFFGLIHRAIGAGLGGINAAAVFWIGGETDADTGMNMLILGIQGRGGHRRRYPLRNFNSTICRCLRQQHHKFIKAETGQNIGITQLALYEFHH